MRMFLAALLVTIASLEIAGHQMKPNAAATEPSPAKTLSNVTIASVISKDGTAIGYRQLGRGPGL
jgi:hypothetical protein